MSTRLLEAPSAEAAQAAALPPRARPGALLVLGYLAATYPLLLCAPQAPARLTWALGHAAAMAAVVWSLTRGGPRLLAWVPLLLTSFYYAELPVLMRGGANPAYRDAAVIAWERAVFGGLPARTLAGDLPWTWLSELLHAGYLSYYAMIFAVPAAMYLRRRRRDFATAELAVLGTFVACYLAFILFPVEGPRYLWGAPAGLPEGPFRGVAIALAEAGTSRGTTFPSSHGAVAVAATLAGLRLAPRLGAVLAVLTGLLMVGAVYGGFHYAVDMVAGGLLGGVVAGGLLWARRRHGERGRA